MICPDQQAKCQQASSAGDSGGWARNAALRRILVTCLSLLLVPTPVVRADQIVAKGVNHLGARIITVADGSLRFRAADGRTLDAPLGEIELVIVDRAGIFDDFNQAERFLASGDPQKAAVRFERMLRLATGFWIDLIAARLIVAHDRAGHLDEAVRNFVRVVRGQRSGVTAAARLIPQTVPVRRDARFGRAIRELDVALSANPTDEQRTLLQLVRYEILRRMKDQRAGRAASMVATAPIGVPIRSAEVYAILLPALRSALEDGVTAVLVTALDDAIRDCPDGALPDFLLLKGETLLRAASTRDEIIRASWPFLRVVVHMPDDPRAADGLLGAARALERLERVDQAKALVSECLQRDGVSEAIREQARTMLARFQTEERPSG